MSSRRTSVTAEKLESYELLIETATDDLQDHLDSIDEKLEAIFRRAVTESNSDSTELSVMKEERLSTQRCLQICDELSEHIKRISLPSGRGSYTPGPIDIQGLPEKTMHEGLRDCRNSLVSTVAKLERHMKDLTDKMVAKSRAVMASEDDIADLVRLQEEWETARHCVSICSKAEDHLEENISVIENNAHW